VVALQVNPEIPGFDTAHLVEVKALLDELA
jgi:hypothetical protein